MSHRKKSNASNSTSFDGFAIDDSYTRFWIYAHGLTNLLVQAGHRLFPGPIELPLTEVVIQRLSVGQIIGQQSPGTSSTQHVEDAIDDFTSGIGS